MKLTEKMEVWLVLNINGVNGSILLKQTPISTKCQACTSEI